MSLHIVMLMSVLQCNRIIILHGEIILSGDKTVDTQLVIFCKVRNKGFALLIITEHSTPQLTKEALDTYSGAPAVPAFQLQLKMLEPTALVQRVGFLGVTPENSYITITKEPRRGGMSK